MSSSSFLSLQQSIQEAKQLLGKEKCVMLCIGNLEKLREIYLNLFSTQFGIITVIRSYSDVDKTFTYTNCYLQSQTLPREAYNTEINVVYIDKATKSFLDEAYANCMQIKYNAENDTYSLHVPEEKKSLAPNKFSILPSNQYKKSMKITSPVLLLESQKGVSLPYDATLFSYHFPMKENHHLLQMSSVSKYSTAYCSDGQYTAQLVACLIKSCNPAKKEVSIVDACANVGGNTIWFSQSFSKVHAVELDTDEFLRLQNNCEIMGCKNVSFYNQSCLDVIAKLSYADVYFYDPPWGGPSYSSIPKDLLVLGLDSHDVVELIDNAIAQGKASMYVLKHPENTRIDSKFPHITLSLFRRNATASFVKPFYSLTIWFSPQINSEKALRICKEQQRFLLPLECIPSHDRVKKQANAFVWLVMKGDAYIPGAVASMYSIRNKSKHPEQSNLVVMVTSDVSADGISILKQYADYIVNVDVIEKQSKALRTEKQRTLYQHWIEQSYTKWQALRLPFQKVCCLDCDVIALEDVTSLFSLQTPAAPFNSAFAQPAGKIPNHYTKAAKKQDIGLDGYCKHGVEIPQSVVKEGLMNKTTTLHGTSVVLSPNLTEFARFMVMLASEEGPFGFDTNSGFDEQSLALFYSDRPWTNVHHRYNFLAWKTDGYLSKQDTPAILHFSSQPKPWQMDCIGSYSDVIVWYDVFVHALTDTNISYPNFQSVLSHISSIPLATKEDYQAIVNTQDKSYLKQWKM